MRLIVAGHRKFTDKARLFRVLDHLTAGLDKKQLVILSGHAKGADQLGEAWCFERRVMLEVYHAEWEKHGKAAGAIRNKEMASKADALVAFLAEGSIGTRNMIGQARLKGLKVKVIHIEEDA